VVHDPAPWTRGQLVAAGAVGAVGGVALVAAWWGSAEEHTLTGQVGWLNLATVALVVALCGGGSLLLFGRRAIGARRRRLLAGLVDDVPATTSVPAGTTGQWLWLPGTRRAHRPGCALVRGKAAEAIGAGEIRRHGLARCEVCGS
jgi:hypothetical protein